MKNLKILILFIFISGCVFSQKAEKGVDLKTLDKYIEKSMKDWQIPGMSIAIVKGDKIIFSKGYGLRNSNKKEEVNAKTLFSVASNTKAFTSSALSILVDEGKINWDDKVIKYLPYFQLYDPYVTNEMTVRDLLCHRSGLKTFSGDLLWYESNYTAEEVIKRARFLKPTFSFRNNFGYSNIMFSVAGQIIPAVTKISWGDYVKDKFFGPLEMKNSLVSVEELKTKTNIASPHHVVFDKKPIPIEYMQWDNIAPAAAIISNAEDMSNWLIMQMNDGVFKGKKILDKDQLWETQSPQIAMKISRTGFQNNTDKHFMAYGLGWFLYDYKNTKIVTHGGGADGMISKTMIMPEEKFGLVILTNSINSLSSALLNYITEDYFGNPEKDWSTIYLEQFKSYEEDKKKKIAEEENKRNKNTKPSLDLKEYTGTYGGELYGNAKVVLENGKLVVKFLPSPKFVGDLTHWQFNTFAVKLRNSITLPKGKVNFILDADGKVEEMRIDIPNPDFYFTELEFKKIN